MSTVTASQRRFALGALTAATVVWGISFVWVKTGMGATAAALDGALGPGEGARLAPLTFLALRFALATVACAALPGAISGIRAPGAARDVLAVSLPFFVGFVLQNYGLMDITATVSAFFTSVYVVLVPVIVIVARRTSIPGRLVAGIALVLSGITIIAQGPGSTFGRGEVLTLLCAVAFSYQVYLIDAAARRTPANVLTFWTMALTAAGSVTVMALLPGGLRALSPAALQAVASDFKALSGIVFSAIMSSVVAIWIMYRYQSYVSPTRAAIVYAAEPVVTLISEAILGVGGIQVRHLWGAALILIGNLVAELRRREG